MSASRTDLPELDPVLEAIYRRGYAIRRRRALGRITSVAIVLQLLVAVPYALGQGGDNGHRVRVVAPAGQEETTTTSAAPTVVEGVTVDATPTPTSAAPVPAPSPTTTAVCRNSTDPRCGPFRWDPDPGPNAPFTITVTVETASPRAGEPVQFRVVTSDPDNGFWWGKCQGFGDAIETCIDGSRFGPSDSPNYCAREKFGPWTPPPRDVGYHESSDYVVTHTYDRPGTYDAHWRFRSDSTGCSYEPYGSTAEAFVRVLVQPAAETTTTTTAG